MIIKVTTDDASGAAGPEEWIILELQGNVFPTTKASGGGGSARPGGLGTVDADKGLDGLVLGHLTMKSVSCKLVLVHSMPTALWWNALSVKKGILLYDTAIT